MAALKRGLARPFPLALALLAKGKHLLALPLAQAGPGPDLRQGAATTETDILLVQATVAHAG